MGIYDVINQIENNQEITRSDIQLLITTMSNSDEDLEMLSTYLNEISFLNQETIEKIVGDVYSYDT